MAKLENLEAASKIARRLQALRYMRKERDTSKTETFLQLRLYMKGSPEPLEKFLVEPHEVTDFLISIEARMLVELHALGVTE